MAIEVMSWVLDHSRSKHGARLVLIAVANCMNAPDVWAWPSNKELQRQTNLTERAVRIGVAELVELGELSVDLNSGPGGCNRYRVNMTATPPAESAPGKVCPPAESAPPQNLPPSGSVQVNSQTPAKFAPPQNLPPRQDLPHPPAESAPGTVIEPKEKISPTERSTSPEIDDTALFAANGNGTAPKPKAKRGRPAGRTASDPQFAEWYNAYPVHKAIGDAEQAYAKAIRGGADPAVLLDAAKRYRDTPDVLRGYGKHPATWLNKKCWLDEDMPPIQQPPTIAVDHRQQATNDLFERAMQRAEMRERQQK